MQQARGLPLFPLDTVLFPGGTLPLRIFEPRYVDMVRRCLREGSAFVVLQPQSAVGTEARIVDFDSLPDGLLGISCRGGPRVRVLERWQQPDGLHVGVVEALPEAAAVAVPARFERLAVLLRALLPEVPELYPRDDWQLDDAGWVSGRLTELLPIPMPDKQLLLEMDEPLQRLAWLSPRIRIEDELERH
jgi:uncharacterized protein